MGKDEWFIAERTYDSLNLFLARIARFPRSHRDGLG